MRISLAFIIALTAVAVACGDSAGPTGTNPAPAVRYTVRDLTPTIGDSSTVLRLNNSGWVLGIAGATLDPAKRPFIWNDGLVQFLDGCGYPEDLNNSGAVLCLRPPPTQQLVIWKDGVATPFAPFDTVPIRATQQLNDSGYVAEGYAGENVCGPKRYCALVVGRPTLTVMPSPVPITQTLAINTRGDVLAQGLTDGFYDQPTLLFDPTGDTVQTIIPGRSGYAFDMNDSGHVVGGGYNESGSGTAWIWQAGAMDTIGPGSANSINNSDVVVGATEIGYTATTFAFRWQKGGAPVPLDSLIDDPAWKIENATLINDAGQIVATGSNAALGVQHHIVLLEPRPAGS